jgi:hypothetical protein
MCKRNTPVGRWLQSDRTFTIRPVTWVGWLIVAAVGWTVIATIIGFVLARMMNAATDF